MRRAPGRIPMRRPIRRATIIRRPIRNVLMPRRLRRSRKPAAARSRSGARQLGCRVRAGCGQAHRDAGLSDRLGARSLAGRIRATGRDALVRRARGRDQADLRLFLPRHERQFACAYFRTRLRQRPGYRGIHAGRRPAHFGGDWLEGRAGRAGLSARRAGVGLPRVHHRAGARIQRLSLQSYPRRPDAPGPPAHHLPAGRGVGRGSRGARVGSAIPMLPTRSNSYAREPGVTGSLGKPSPHRSKAAEDDAEDD